MGCGASAETQQAKPAERPEKGPKASKNYGAEDKKEKGGTGGANKPSPKAGGSKEDDPEFAKTMGDFGPGLFAISKDKKFYVSAVKTGDKTLELTAISADKSTPTCFSGSFGETELGEKKGSKLTWPAVFKSLKSAFASCSLSVKEGGGGGSAVSVHVPMEPGSAKTHISLQIKSAPASASLGKGFLDPMCEWFAKRRGSKAEERYLKAEADLNEKRAACSEIESRIKTLQSEIEPLQKNARSATDDAAAAKEQCDTLLKQIEHAKNPGKPVELYPDGPTQFLLHTPHAKVHVPAVVPYSTNALTAIKQKYGGDTGGAKIEGVDHEGILAALSKIDTWEFDVFDLAKHSNGCPLFMTTYCLLYKYGLAQHFKLKDDVIIHFLQALESGYHPNPYHNATHAADVLQITHYIISPGGMAESIKMTHEDRLAGLLSAAIHDYDHPGFNNNFHCRTGAYLATLYNDRSVLENHHLAQVFDLMKTDKYNVLGTLSYDSYKDVRDTMTEMVLSTDMGNHAKIFQQFRKRLSDEPEWTKKEDQRLALSIAIKMADISNCGRPEALYQKWAQMIADEFYNQGDVEQKLNYAISPFMDRRKHDADFPKGQISFMNYIVIPLFEAGAQLLPKMEFTVDKINQNKEYWAMRQKPAENA
eukprot:NODE_140_length_2141_cov_73.474181_g117_i0.p1 GENE.NODE_140_length_2141_cov_73.474181_g117_i0~~NODE_140_length_2141_cov_73.474181_g117_i0.p1  ORF type:complete len:647 (+),score=134.06 NODE_140_length_2141_cov_73.474181_g117_i0:101-2041(+)